MLTQREHHGPVFSLIIATIGRRQEIAELLASISNQQFDIEKIEIIIVDQNSDNRVKEALRPFAHLQIRHIQSKRPGLSLNRNIGLKAASGEIVCFPDDDCKFYGDTLSSVSNEFFGEEIDFAIGRIVDRCTGQSVIRNWPIAPKEISRRNFYFLSSSITIFLKRELAPAFNENLGAGCVHGSCEDAEYIYRLLEERRRGRYAPTIEVWHPTPDFAVIPLPKVRSYASGFGYFVSNKPDATKCILLAMLLVKKATQAVRNLCTREFSTGYFKAYFGGLLEGLRAGRRPT